ncbi:phosphatidate cytidylyltransferase [bacterium]|nr:phosphatidate cytidylyltransferase [bacterium]
MSNLLSRFIVAFAGIPVLLWCAWSGGYPLWGLVALLQIFMLLEWKQLLIKRGFALSIFRSIILLLALYATVFHQAYPGLAGAAILLIAFWLISALFREDTNRFAAMGGEILFIIYIAFPLILWPYLGSGQTTDRFSNAGALVLLFTATWFCDSGAYFIGSLWGRHKLFERASPKKTIEGAIGGLFFSALPLVIIKLLKWGSPTPLDYIVLPLAVSVFGQAGDLLESLFKREAGVKDSSRLLPGHGGLLDRFDSLLLSTPAFYAYLILIR